METYDSVFIFIEFNFKNLVKKTIREYFQDEDERKDVYQDILIYIYEKLKISSQNDYIKWKSASWLRIIVKNKCIDILRVQKNTVYFQKKFLKTDSHFESVINESGFDRHDNTNEHSKSLKKVNVNHILANLTDREREIVNLRYTQNASIKEIDSELEITNSAVYLKRIIDKLKKVVSASTFFNFFDGFSIED